MLENEKNGIKTKLENKKTWKWGLKKMVMKKNNWKILWCQENSTLIICLILTLKRTYEHKIIQIAKDKERDEEEEMKKKRLPPNVI